MNPSSSSAPPAHPAVPSASAESDAPQLARRLGLFDATMIVMGGIVGSGIFVTPYVVARQVHTPADLEAKFGLVGGDIFHGRMSLDQLWAARPVLGHGDYRSPIAGLYMCGSGTHPGGGVTGAPGHNAAQAILADRRLIGRWRRRA